VIADAGKKKEKRKKKKPIYSSNNVSLELVYAGWLFW